MITHSLSRLAPGSISGTLLRLPLRLLPRNYVINVRGGLNRGLKWVVGTSVHGCWLGHYEMDKQEVVGRLVSPGMTAFDIGANAGFYTLAFARLVGPSGHVFAFEPLPQNAANLLRHIALNSLENATLVQVAVSDRTGLATFQAGMNNSAGKLGDGPAVHTVPIASVDDLVEQCGLPAPDIVKVDVEGAEVDVLRGAARVLARGTTTFLVALHGHQLMRDCVALFEGYGYTIRTLSDAVVTATDEFVDEIVANPPRR